MGEIRNYHSPKADLLGSWGRAKLGGWEGEKHDSHGVLVGRVEGGWVRKKQGYTIE